MQQLFNNADCSWLSRRTTACTSPSSRCTLQPTRAPKFSDMVSAGTSTAVSRRKGPSPRRCPCESRTLTQLRTWQRLQELDSFADGLQRDADVVFVPMGSAEEALLSPASQPRQPDFLKDGSPPGDLSRAVSEPDLGAHPDSGLGEDEPTTGSSMFELPGFESVEFRNSISGTLLSLPSCRIDDEEASSIALPCGSVMDSIGSSGSLARMQSLLPWEDVEDVYYGEDEWEDSSGGPRRSWCSPRPADSASRPGRHDASRGGRPQDHGRVPLGPRKKLLRAVEQRRLAFQDPREVAISRL
ncbi:hypothetical protein HPB50_026927 [Hyalomma asiaticum]|uniref:Uncharacterized protein n=1 Tax=Hyalomma asiaticum TaxID=266040 RepID=A0ACB7TBY2_HYAAI|nr:hypothetical protein HPB50_026927 [Hyalomma asiaticum]